MKTGTGSAGQAAEQAATGGDAKDAAVKAVEEKAGDAAQVPLTEEELKKKAEEEAAAKAKAAEEAGKAVEKPAGGSG